MSSHGGCGFRNAPLTSQQGRPTEMDGAAARRNDSVLSPLDLARSVPHQRGSVPVRRVQG
ncbi:hypothetical protein SAMN05216223_12551 [Actinacidiphila yanglinensis]|uniref:Uncharacterized protein n=1 Tax=Actinacidiphila yanglinensis TaxID=310779 RepID=A0A1H6E397_9ACTN|nr:hypothetical protein SAMN05216223_12551 [Actinacidiphila yanglinensis]